ncbi:PKD domain-containing protein [Haloarcula nitratireducens]|uniref:PKD domain-containing protein n=1 Tax=Haloarcula nitratireducens TaxID=2487749 RepID=A0AAW4PC71_9EURY|nr:PKD domain-containing protein [Halomicroarcula nitratireducens]MBX0295323.1 PKD domain-containing protein [Halomicroarcula nitratireducens]
MSTTIQTRFKRATAAFLALAVILSVLGPVGTAAAAPSVSVSQSADSTTVNPGGTVTFTTDLTVEELNAPQLNVTTPDGWTITNQEAEGGPAYDGDGTWQWFSGGSAGANVSYTVTYTVQVPGDASPGEYTIDAEGSAVTPETDSTRFADTDSTTITVEEEQTNTPPTADAGGDQTVDEGDDVTLDASGSDDPDGDSLSYTWTQTAGPSVSVSDTVSPTFTAPSVDSTTTLTFEVEVADGNGGTDTDTVSVTVDPVNEDPSASISGPTSAQVGEELTFDAVASDDGSIASYEWDFDDGETASGQSVTHAFDSEGDYTVELTVTDDEGATTTATQTVSVSAAPAPANFQITNLDAPASATQGDTVTVEATVENTGDEEATQTVEFTFDGSVIDSQDVTLASGASEDVQFTLDTTGVAAGTYTHGVSTDDDTASAQITVEAASEPSPGAVDVSLVPADQTATTGDEVTYDVVVSGTDDVGAFEGNVTVSDTSNAIITDVSTPATGDNQNVDFTEQTAEIGMYGLPQDADDPVTVATITLSAESVGETDISLSDNKVYNQQGTGYTIDSTNDATLSVSVGAVVGDTPPANMDDDAVLEDINGSGEFNIVDVQALFSAYTQDKDVVLDNVEQFDFNGDGEISIGDVQAAFYEVTTSQ